MTRGKWRKWGNCSNIPRFRPRKIELDQNGEKKPYRSPDNFFSFRNIFFHNDNLIIIGESGGN